MFTGKYLNITYLQVRKQHVSVTYFHITDNSTTIPRNHYTLTQWGRLITQHVSFIMRRKQR